MCGIVGIAGSLACGDRAVARRLLLDASERIAHRGPDGGRTWACDEAAVGFGHRRLAIIDLSEAANQPMVWPGGRHVIVYNGELYNYLELKSELVADGVAFSTESDTEVLLAACRARGVPQALRRANGMFAFGYADLDANELWLCRDRFGEKPLYYAVWGGSLAFASELKALRPLPGFPCTVDRTSLDLYFRRQAVPAPSTIYQGVRHVRPGAAMRVQLSDRIEPSHATEVVYWSAETAARSARSAPFTGSLSDAADELDDVLGSSVRSRMISDVPLGALLSGGIDSTSVVAQMCRFSTGPVKTFTIGFAEERMSEAAEARKVAAHLGVDHTELTVTASDALALIPRLAEMYDEPFADSSQIPTFLVAQLARAHVTVALSGDGGDELFGGYNRYFLAGEAWGRISRVPRPVRVGAGRVLTKVSIRAWDRVTPLSKRMSGGVGDRMHKLGSVAGARDAAHLYEMLVTHWDGGIVRGASPATVEPLASGMPFTEQMMLRDTVTYLPDDVLTKVDRAAMATSLETRVPILDPEVFRLAWSLPAQYRARAGTGKVVLRELLGRYVPSDLWSRPKAGFGLPLDSWLRGPLRAWGDDLLDGAVLRRQGFLDAEVVTRRWREHVSGSRNWQHQIWDVLMFQSWLNHWF